MLKKLSLVLLMSSTLFTHVTYAMDDEPSKGNQLPISLEKNDGAELCKSGLSLLREGNRKQGIRQLKAAIKLGDVEAMRKMAAMYEEGINVKENPQKALKLYRNLLELNPKSATSYYSKLIKKGNIDAMVDLANFYMSKELTSETKRLKAIKLYEKAITKENPQAMNGLAQLFEKYYCDYTFFDKECIINGHTHSYEGERSVFHKVRALMLYKQASDLGYEEAERNLKQLCEKLTSNFQRGSKNGDHLGSYRRYQQAGLLTTYLVQGKSISDLENFFKDDHCEFLNFLKKPMKLKATLHLCPFYVRGWMYENGYGVEQNISKAVENYFIIMYCKGNIIHSDCSRIAKKAYKELESIKIPLHRWSVVNRGLMERYEPEKTRCLLEEMIQELTDNDNDIKGHALRALASMYKEGIGGLKDINKARELYQQASDLGNEKGRKMYKPLTNSNDEIRDSAEDF